MQLSPAPTPNQRTLRLADGPDEVHNRTIAGMELARYGDLQAKIRAERDAERVPGGDPLSREFPLADRR